MKAVILDRDGVINFDSDAYIKNADEWRPIAGSIAAIAKLYQKGFTIFVLTNQSGLGRGLFSTEELTGMHTKMHNLVGAAGGKIERVFYCPHRPDDDCGCRKPRTGLFDQVERYMGASLNGVPSVGDSLRDLQAARLKGCRALLVRSGNGEKTLQQIGNDGTLVFKDLAAAADWILKNQAGS